MKRKWNKPSTWFGTNKEAIRFPKLYGNVFATLIGGVSVFQDDYDTYLNEGYAKNDVVRAIVDKISNGASSAKFYLKNKRTGEPVYNKHFELMIKNAGPNTTFAEVVKEGITQKLLTGNAYYVGEKGKGVNSKLISNLYVVPSANMQIRGTKKGITGYSPNVLTGFEGQIPASNVVHVKTVNPTYNSNDSAEWLYGVPPLRSAKESIQTYNDSKLAGLYFLQNKGGQKGLVLREDAMLSPEGEDMLKQQIRKTSQGVSNNANLPIFEGVEKTIDLSADPKKALVIEQRLQAAQEICNVFNFPSQLIGLSNATYQNAKEAKKALWEFCIIPELKEVVDGLNRGFITQYGENIELCFDLEHIDALQEDKLLRGQAITSFAGLVTINQALEMAGLPTYDWMKTPTNMEEYKEQMYHGFTQMAVTDEETTEQGSSTEDNEDSEEQAEESK